MTDKYKRNERGRFGKGNNANSKGANGHQKGWQRYEHRFPHWAGKTVKEITDILSNRNKLYSYSAIDIACIRHVARTFSEVDDVAQRALDSALDRVEGKATGTQVIQNPDGSNITPTVINVVGVAPSDDES